MMAAQHKRRGATAKRLRQGGALGRLRARLQVLERAKESETAYRFESAWGDEYRRLQREIRVLQASLSNLPVALIPFELMDESA
jgi:hypothetical protein